MVNITINIGATGEVVSVTGPQTRPVTPGMGGQINSLDDLVATMGDQIKPFPRAGVDGFLSHFIISMEFLQGDRKGAITTFTMPPASQTVSRSDPFMYQGPGAKHTVTTPLPTGCTLSPTISEGDFLERPPDFFKPGCEAVWLQILNLDAQMEHPELGPIRIILGETLKRDYPDLFRPSLGVAESLGKSGFPARLFFNPYAVIETNFGNFRAIHGTLTYGRTTDFPPIGTPVTIRDMVPMESVDEIRRVARDRSIEPFAGGITEPAARIIALSHPIDTPMHVPGDVAFRYVEQRIQSRAPKRKR
jgi:hypothetical protein